MTDEFATHFETLAIGEATHESPVAETIVPDSMRRGESVADLLATLPTLATRVGDESRGPDLELVGTLGEGGMGVVQLARQVALDRSVAVKTPRDNKGSAGPKLLQEALVTGRLEHPNIIPIYTLGRDHDGHPLIVMKRIEGDSWLDKLKAGETDTNANLEVLLQLCNAVRFAHEHGVIHRDIKPENVMIGRFGEVYLLDWGIAVSLDDEGPEGIPRRSDVRGLCGTPCYMAPEMTGDDAVDQDRRTDIYLLGAVLHEILTGKPRHLGDSLFDVMRSAFENQPVDYPDAVPAELGAIANKAMASAREDRYQSVDEFRDAINDYLAHRGASELIAEAEGLLARIAKDRLESTTDEQAFELHDLFIECRFACRQALRAWPDNEHAHKVYARYLDHRFSDAVLRRDTVVARGVLVEMEERGLDAEDKHAALASLVSEHEQQAEELRGLRAIASQIDLREGRVSRSAAVALMGLLWGLNTAMGFFARIEATEEVQTGNLAGAWRVLAIAAVGMFLFRKKLFRTTKANRRIAYIVVVAMISMMVSRVAYDLLPGNIALARSMEVAMYGSVVALGGVILDDLRVSGLGLLYYAAALLEATLGPYSSLFIGGSHIIVGFTTAWLWTPRQLERRISV